MTFIKMDVSSKIQKDLDQQEMWIISIRIRSKKNTFIDYKINLNIEKIFQGYNGVRII